MTQKIALKATKRDNAKSKAKKLRSEGFIPAVLYGRGIANTDLSVEKLAFERVYAQAGESAIVQLEIDGAKQNVLVYEVQTEPISGAFAHIDFYQVRMDEEVEANIPLEFIGESEAVKALGGTLVKNMDEVLVSCLPGDLPQNIEVDLSLLKTFEDHITVGDLKVPARVKFVLEPETIVAGVSAPRSEEELAALDEKVEADVTKVEGVVKEAPATEGK
ncbi:MAG TPA: 50S ribosomal protein L25 [Candidatus Moranbacteria bacterium]|mgnify:CR=1 FL=1|nr:50S ribosomal protein L25 [Candidatus Moranbacteria bacterium]